MAIAFEPLNRSLETFLTRLSRTNQRSEKSRRVFKKPRCYKDEYDICIDTWIEVMKLHFEGKKTSSQVYVRDVIRRQQELNDLCRRNTQQAQARQRKRFDKKAGGAKAYSVGDYVWVFQNVIPPKGTKKLLEKWREPFMITEVHQEGRFYRLSTGRAAHYENIKPHNLSTEDWCIPADMEEGVI